MTTKSNKAIHRTRLRSFASLGVSVPSARVCEPRRG